MTTRRDISRKPLDLTINLLEPPGKGFIVILKFLINDSNLSSESIQSLRLMMEPKIQLDEDKGRSIQPFSYKQNKDFFLEFDYFIWDRTYAYQIYKELRAKLSA